MGGEPRTERRDTFRTKFTSLTGAMSRAVGNVFGIDW